MNARRKTVAGLVTGIALAAVLSAQGAFDALLADLRSSHDGTRARAVRALVTAGYPDTPRALAPLLADPADAVQLETVDALLALVLAPAPSRQLGAPFKARNGSIAAAVFEAGPLAVLPRVLPDDVHTGLAAATRDEDPRVRSAAAWALGVLGGPGMGGVPPGVQPALVVDLVYAMRHPDAATREALIYAVGTLFDVPGRTPPVAIGDALIAAMNDASAPVRLAASTALGWTREPRAVQALAERLAYYKKGPEAEAALHALSRMAHAESAGTFRQYVAQGPTAARVMAIEALGRLGDRSAVEAITAALAADRSTSVALAGAFAFYLLGEPSNLDRLVTGLADPGSVRQARVYLTELGAEAAPRLHARLSDPDPIVRQRVVEVIGLSGHAASAAALQPLTRDPDPAVGEVARQALERLRLLPAGARIR